MNLHSLFPPLMVITFIAAILTLLVGVSGMMNTASGKDRSTQLMALRVGLCGLLLIEILIYITFVRV